jgi:uncharacterized protein (TIRG00374 family)
MGSTFSRSGRENPRLVLAGQKFIPGANPAMQQKIIKISAILCLGMFIYFIIRANPGELLHIISSLSLIGILLLILLRFLFWVIRTISWRLVLTRCSTYRVSFSKLFWAELAGHAMGYFTPSAKLGGDAIRAMMLSPVPKNQALASVVIDKTIELISTILMMSLGLFITLLSMRMGLTQRIVFLSLTAFTAVLIFIFFRMDTGYVEKTAHQIQICRDETGTADRNRQDHC